MNAPYYSDDLVTLHLGDCLDVLAGMPDASVDAVVTDPPYGLGFMGKEWDSPGKSFVERRPDKRNTFDHVGGNHNPENSADQARTRRAEGQRFQAWCETWAAECLRVLKPGGYLLAFGGARTWHRLTCAIEDAGFEIRDSLHWIYGSGFPKSLDVSKAIDKAAGAQREVTGRSPDSYARTASSWQAEDGRPHGMVGRGEGERLVTAPATDAARQWDGWGTALKPAHEPVIMARKPFRGTVAANVLEHGTGALNVAACKVGSEARINQAGGASSLQRVSRVEQGYRPTVTASSGEDSEVSGRWPPNVLLTHGAGCRPVGVRQVKGAVGGSRGGKRELFSGLGAQPEMRHLGYADADGLEVVEAWECAPGCPVAELDRQSGVLASGANPARRGSDTFRDAYGEFTGQEECIPVRGADSGGASRFFPVFRYEAKAGASERPRLPDGTAHPTVKPVGLMRWLVRLVTPPSVDVLICSDCGQELRGVQSAVPAQAPRADRVQPGVQAEASREGAQGTGESLPDVRQAPGGRTREEILQRGLPGDGAAQAQDLHHLRDGVPGAPADAGDVLAAVRGQSGDAQAEGLRGVRQRIPARFEQESFLLASVRGEGDGASKAEGADAHPSRIRDPLPAGSPDVEQAGLSARTPQGDGGRPGPDAVAVGSCASQERGQGRQPSGEPRGAAEAGARQDPQASAQADRVPALPRDDRCFGSCPACRGALIPVRRPGLVLDPFCGSGATGEACVIEGFRAVLIERDPKSAELVMTRLRKPIQPDLFGGAA